MLLTAVAVIQLARCVAAGDVAISKGILTFSSSEKGGTVTCPVDDGARDFTKFGSLQWTFRSTSTIKWNLGLRNAKGETTTFRVMPYEGVRTTASLPVRYLTTDFLNNKAFVAHALSNWANHIDVTNVQAVTIQMAPNRDVQLDLGPMVLSKEVLPDSAEITKPLVDEYGQWMPDHPLTGDQIRTAWKNEKFDALSVVDPPRLKATGFFHTEEKDGKWWLVDPDGSAFFSLGMDCVRLGDVTPTEGREKLFTQVVRNPYLSNTERRASPWKKTAIERLRSWGFNTVANWSDTQFYEQAEMPFVMNVSVAGVKKNWEGFPDVYSDAFRAAIEGNAGRQCGKFKRERLLIGYFIGNEPHWQNRGLVDRILNDPEPSATRDFVKSAVAKGVSRDELLETLAREYFSRVVSAIKKADPNHLVLGIRWAGNAPDPVMRANEAFDVFSINIYRFAPPVDQIRKIYELCRRPIMIGEFHFGAVGRGMAPSLVMVKDQHERGVAYRYYVEQAAALAPVVGVHYFQFIDQPVSGRYDGENYNLGFVNVQDIPYPEMVSAAREAHGRIYRIHAGELAPTSEQANVR